MADLYPDTLPFKVEATTVAHQMRIGEFHGLAHALDVLEKIPAEKRTPGFAYALALIERELADARAAVLTANLKAIAAAGHDINRIANVSAQGFTLICAPLPPGEEA